MSKKSSTFAPSNENVSQQEHVLPFNKSIGMKVKNLSRLYVGILGAVILSVATPMRAEDIIYCSQCSIVVETFLDSTMCYLIAPDPGLEQPYVDSIWIADPTTSPQTIYFTSHAQPRERFDISFLKRNHYVCFAQIGDCVTARMFGFRGRNPEDQVITSLCDTWNVMVVENVTCGGCEDYRTQTHRLAGDTIIGGLYYRKLIYDDPRLHIKDRYEGALREGNNRDIYFIPAGTTHEYLLYAFNAQVSDQLDNLWIGVDPYTYNHVATVHSITVTGIQETTPRIFNLRMVYTDSYDGKDFEEYEDITWIEGVGMWNGPIGRQCTMGCADSRGIVLLCAYKDGELVYEEPTWTPRVGCWYDSNEQAGDTVKLYRHVNDGPGSSTVDPVDPNQIVVILQQDLLIMREYMGDEIQYSLQKSLAANAPAKSKLIQADSFRGSASVQLTEDGTYRLDLTNPDWDYSIYGVFDYGTVGLDPVIPDAPATKVIRNGHLFIQKGDKIFTFTGVRIE